MKKWIKKIMPHLDKKLFSPYFFSLVLTAIAVYVALPFISTTPQKYVDLSVDILINQDLNKTGELYLIWILISLSIVYTVITKINNIKDLFCHTPGYLHLVTQQTEYYKIPIVFGLPIISNWLFGTSPDVSFIFAFVLLLFGFSIGSNNTLLIFNSVFIYYGTLAIFCFLGLRFNIPPPKNQLLIAISITSSILLFNFTHRSTFKKYLLLIQTPIPLLLTYFLIYRYDLDGTMEYLPFSPQYRYFFYILIMVLGLLSLGQIFTIVKNDCELKTPRYILLSSVVSIFIFNSYTAPTLYYPLDMHHSGESFATWVQLTEFGKSLYVDYILPSGLFSIFNGFVNHLMFDGGATNFNPLVVILKTFWCAATICLLYLIFGAEAALLIALLLSFSNYDRTYSLLVFILILAIPWVIRRSHLWLQVFISLSILEFLYYPLYGLAFFIGGLPMSILQIGNIKTRMHLRFKILPKINRVNFIDLGSTIFGWGVTGALVVASFPLLMRIFHHASQYGAQTTVADGIAVFGRQSDYFMNYIPWELVRTGFLYISLFFIPIVAIVLLTDLLSTKIISNIKVRNSSSHTLISRALKKNFHLKWRRLLSADFFCLSSSILILIVTYQYSLQRLDFGYITARSGPVILILIGMLIPSIVFKYSKNFGTNELWKFIIIGLCITIAYNHDTNYRAPPLTFVHKVPSDFIRIKEHDREKLPKIGHGYIQKDNLAYLLNLQDQLQDYKNAGLKFTNLGYLQYYTLGLNNSATSTFYIAKSKETQQGLISIMQSDRPVIAPINGFMSSYIYKWAVNEGYVSDKHGYLVPPGYNFQNFGERHVECSRSFYFNQDGFYASSLGRSYDSLRPFLGDKEYARAFEPSSVPVTLRFEKSLIGRDVDLVMLTLSSPSILNIKNQEALFVNNHIGNKNKIIIEFIVETNGTLQMHSMTASYGHGVLLFPMFANCYWRDGNIVSISIKSSSSTISDIKINDIKLFHWKKFDDPQIVRK